MTGAAILLVALTSGCGLCAAEGLPGYIARVMQGKAGAVIVSDPRTEQILAIWNQQEQHLILARDHTGERPLFYASTANCFAFASMPKGLHRLPFVGAEVDEDYIARCLVLVNTDPT